MAASYAAPNSPDSAMVGAGIMDMDESRVRHLPIPAPILIGSPVDSDSSFPSPLPSPRNALPPPNPHFVFPARPGSSSAPSSYSRATGQRSRAAVDSHDGIPVFLDDMANSAKPVGRPRRSPALPDFSFNPSVQLHPESAAADHQPRSLALPEFSFNPSSTMGSNGSMMSPPLSPSSPRMIPNRGGHRRGGSEFVGGNLRDGESITVMSTSPTKSESGYASPKLSPVEPPTRRGRHAHRRSAAISSHDLSMILKPTSPNPSRGSSAPTSPADFEEKTRPFPETSDRPNEEPAETLKPEPQDYSVESREEEAAEPAREPSPPARPAARARVGFSDTLEFIPRPLSMVSTDTTSTVTGLPSHSVSGSISSIISLTTSTVADRELSGIQASPVSSKKSGSRPSTAGAVLERTPSLHSIAVDEDNAPSPRRRNSIPILAGLPFSESSPGTPSPSKVPKRWSFFGLESLAPTGSPTRPRPHSSSSSESGLRGSNSATVLAEKVPDEVVEEPEPQSETKKSSGKKKKKQKKVKSWAGSILTRKTKSRSQKAKAARRLSQTPPPQRLDIYDNQDECGVNSPGPLTAPMVMVTEPFSTPDDSSLEKPRRKSEDDASYPMIDLDAALGPFNTPSGRDDAWDAAQRAAGAPPKRQLHSAVGMRGFSGPGMHYHRRAESAPEMPPFEAGRFGLHRFGSSSTMADVFEEDEEDDEESDAESSTDELTPDASGTSVLDFDAKSAPEVVASTPMRELDLRLQSSKESFALPTSVKRKGSGSSLDMQPPGSRAKIETSANSLHEDVIVEEGPVHTAVDQERIYETFHELTDSTVPLPRRIISNKDLAPVEIHPVNLTGSSMMVSPYSMSHASSFPSPRSPMSYDAHRVSTAPSSITEESNLQSLLLGEPGPEVVRISVDVPSLTSSNSTMTRESNYPGIRPRNMPFPEQRPASFTSTAFGRRRSSLASLSRLISSAHGERSKLSIEVPMESEPEKKPKTSTTKRLSRMMQFWKPKESTSS